jgi:hypothetical protein
MYEARAVLFSSRHLSRKAARIDAKIDERVNDGSTDERGDDNYQHFQAEGAHTGSPPSKREGLSIKSCDSKKTRPRRRAKATSMRLFGPGCPTRAGRCGNAYTAAPRALCAHADKAQAVAASLDDRSGESWGMSELTRQQKITFGEMRESGVDRVLIYCADHKCSHSINERRSLG